MREIVLAEIGRLEVREAGIPAPGPGEALIRVAVTGICGSDIHGYTGENGRRHPGQVMGHESSGWIAAIGGESVPGLEPGAAVTFNPVVVPEADLQAYAGREQHHPAKTVIGVAAEHPAAFADYVVVPVRNVVPLPPGTPVELGALVEPLAVAVHAVGRVAGATTRRVLVVGGGPIGQSVVLALRAAGVDQVIVSEPSPQRRDLVAALGATVIDPADGDVREQVVSLGGPVDAAIDAVGVSRTLSDALAATAAGGSVCLVGMGAPEVSLPAFQISTEERSIIGSFTYSMIDFREAVRIVGSAPEAYRLLISREVDPADADAAFASLAAGDGTAGKVLVRMGDGPDA